MTTLFEVISNLRKLAPAMYVPTNDIDGVILGVSDESKQHRIRISTVDVCLDITLPVVVQAHEHKASLLIARRSPFPQGSPYTCLGTDGRSAFSLH